jgi:formate dehydrogenase major subunit
VLDPFGKIPEFKYCAVRVTAGGAPITRTGYDAMTKQVAEAEPSAD